MEYNEKKEQELLSKCKYFDGMPQPADTLAQNEQMLWWCERKWLFESMKGYDFSGIIKEYNIAGLKEFHGNDGVPIELKALLFNRYGMCSYSMEQAANSFRNFYTKYYK